MASVLDISWTRSNTLVPLRESGEGARRTLPMGHCNPTGNVVAPGLTETDMIPQLQDGKRAVIEEIPLARIAAPDETAAVVPFLVSLHTRPTSPAPFFPLPAARPWGTELQQPTN
ncbi:hypothetical protein [Streptomyces sp. NPDC006333]|uniref:hypothetical protein n=1 Tax=Streptomyces sp. NPDC006333 TaxID=3156753 RepID=UPI0033AE0DC4